VHSRRVNTNILHFVAVDSIAIVYLRSDHCRFVGDETGRKRPTKQLELWLKENASNVSQLNQIYIPILRQALLGTDKEGEKADALDSEDRSQLLQVLGSNIFLRTPLPARALVALLNIREDDVNHWLQNLHAVLNIPSNPDALMHILHKSFSDFLVGDEGTGIKKLSSERRRSTRDACVKMYSADRKRTQQRYLQYSRLWKVKG
jgi:hypothetical protein